MSFREFRGRLEARLTRPLVDAMADLAGDNWDQEVWTDEVGRALDPGTFASSSRSTKSAQR
jgi:hypothetical protein